LTRNTDLKYYQSIKLIKDGGIDP